MYLLVIDPGDNRTHANMGWAFFSDTLLLTFGEGNPREIVGLVGCCAAIVFEHPEVYRPRHTKGDPNYLFRLAKQIGVIQGIALTTGSLAQFVEVLPKQWKGQVPKEIVRDRSKQILTPAEPRPPDHKLNAWDAIGLGLWYLKRTKWR